ncbi:MAG: cadherin-like beta sandwich domain-containing protein, partial [Prevotellaceae bacterium]|nr:cadherin-like beta sandwich domain-containing protein [Prevotellaceae bacterium]
EPPSTNANLASLSVSGYSIAPTFSASVTSYTLTVPNATNSITVNATAADGKAKSVAGTGAKSLNVGSNTYNIVVTAEDNSSKTYTITVTRETAENNPPPSPSTDATLNNIIVSDGILTPSFSKSTISYTVSVPNNVSSITLTAVKSYAAQIVIGDGAKSLSVGSSNIFNVAVIAENGTTTQTYTITVTRRSATGDDNPTAVATQAAAALHIYPNPVANGELTIDNEALKAGDKIEVYSLSGALLKTFAAAGARSTIDVSALPSGTYLVKAGSAVAKVVKQ